LVPLSFTRFSGGQPRCEQAGKHEWHEASTPQFSGRWREIEGGYQYEMARLRG
jgi:hypothetical protein